LTIVILMQANNSFTLLIQFRTQVLKLLKPIEEFRVNVWPSCHKGCHSLYLACGPFAYDVGENSRGTGLAQWIERSPSTNARQVRCRPGAICKLSLLLVCCWHRGFFSARVSGFPPYTEANISKFQFDQDRGPA